MDMEDIAPETKFAKTVDEVEQSRDLWRKLAIGDLLPDIQASSPPATILLRAHLIVARANRLLGRRNVARASFEQVATASRRYGLSRLEGLAEGALGLVALAEESPSLALRHFRRSQQAAVHCGDRLGQGKARCNIGLAYWDLGKLDSSALLLKEGLVDHLACQSLPDISRAHCNLGLVALAAGGAERASDHLRTSLNVARSTSDVRGVVRTLANLGVAAQRFGDQALARETIAECLSLIYKRATIPSFAEAALKCWVNLARLNEATRDYEGSWAACTSAVGLYDGVLRGRTGEPEWDLCGGTLRDISSTALNCCLGAYHHYGEATWLLRAFWIAEWYHLHEAPALLAKTSPGGGLPNEALVGLHGDWLALSESHGEAFQAYQYLFFAPAARISSRSPSLHDSLEVGDPLEVRLLEACMQTEDARRRLLVSSLGGTGQRGPAFPGIFTSGFPLSLRPHRKRVVLQSTDWTCPINKWLALTAAGRVVEFEGVHVEGGGGRWTRPAVLSAIDAVAEQMHSLGIYSDREGPDNRNSVALVSPSFVSALRTPGTRDGEVVVERGESCFEIVSSAVFSDCLRQDG
jgi:tetratricopeptide (TPR) repeat protein